MTVIGSLEFDFVLIPWQYEVKSLSPFTQYKLVTDLIASGKKDIIGSIVIDFETELHPDGTISGQSTHTYILPEGSFQATYLLNEITPGGKCIHSDISNDGTIVSGSGNFLGSIGTTTVHVTDTPLRNVSVKFFNSAVYPSNS